jgi:hypothetical protein
MPEMAMVGSHYCYFDNPATQKALEDGLPGINGLRHALRLSRASGVPIEQFVGEQDDQS